MFDQSWAPQSSRHGTDTVLIGITRCFPAISLTETKPSVSTIRALMTSAHALSETSVKRCSWTSPTFARGTMHLFNVKVCSVANAVKMSRHCCWMSSGCISSQTIPRIQIFWRSILNCIVIGLNQQMGSKSFNVSDSNYRLVRFVFRCKFVRKQHMLLIHIQEMCKVLIW